MKGQIYKILRWFGPTCLVLLAVKAGATSVFNGIVFVRCPFSVYFIWAWARSRLPDDGPLLLEFVRATLEAEDESV
jgi:hypothetical protein